MRCLFLVIRVNATPENVQDSPFSWLSRLASLIKRQRYSQQPKPDCEVPDAETRTKIKPLPESNGRVYQISPTTVAKFQGDCDRLLAESMAMSVVSKQTSIRLPAVHSFRKIYDQYGFVGVILMECVSNARRLEDCWESLSLWRKFIVLLTLRSYVQQLRKIDLPERTRPGPIGPKPLQCRGLTFGPEFNSRFETCKALERQLDKSHRMAEHCRPSRTIKPLPRSATRNLIFTHNDLSLRNILLDDDDQVWLIDWGSSGFFPPFSEYVSMRAADVTHGFPKSLSRLVEYITPPDEAAWEWVNLCIWDYDRIAKIESRRKARMDGKDK